MLATYVLKYTTSNVGTDDERAREIIKNDFYVDDGLTAVPSSQEALRLIDSSRALCKDGGFNLIQIQLQQQKRW